MSILHSLLQGWACGAVSAENDPYFRGGRQFRRGIKQDIESLFHTQVACVDCEKLVRRESKPRPKPASLRDSVRDYHAIGKRNQLLLRRAFTSKRIHDLLADS